MSRWRLVHEGGSGPDDHQRPRAVRRPLLPVVMAVSAMMMIAGGMLWLALQTV
jgi:hypothetical protein